MMRTRWQFISRCFQSDMSVLCKWSCFIQLAIFSLFLSAYCDNTCTSICTSVCTPVYSAIYVSRPMTYRSVTTAHTYGNGAHMHEARTRNQKNALLTKFGVPSETLRLTKGDFVNSPQLCSLGVLKILREDTFATALVINFVCEEHRGLLLV